MLTGRPEIAPATYGKINIPLKLSGLQHRSNQQPIAEHEFVIEGIRIRII